MAVDITLIIGGEAGQGILTVGELVTATCRKAGFYLFANNEFESRIRGGHSFFQVRISDHPVEAPDNKTHLIVALNPETAQRHQDDLVPKGVILTGDAKKGSQKDRIHIDFEALAAEAGHKITANTVAAGACLALLGTPFDYFKAILLSQFSEKGPDLLEMNIKGAELGYAAVSGKNFHFSLPWSEKEPKGILINGAKAVALGTVAADCRVGAFYPMSPATDIMANMIVFSDHVPLVVEQAEDEISAINMAIGASFAGVRSFTATSGGGFCLMTEGLGLAGITETPVVVVNAQRPGPATGLPTRTAQGDLLFCIYAAQDEFPRFVFAPSNPEEAYEITIRAFDLAEKYQTPTIILMDKYLTDSLFLSSEFKVPESIERYLLSPEDATEHPYLRYKITNTGISPRALPCMGKSLVRVSGNEHREDGHISEDILHRTQMVDKRNAKLKGMKKEMHPPKQYHEGAEILLLGWGSTQGAINEGVDILRDSGINAGSLIFTDIWPFPAGVTAERLAKPKTFFMVEQNSQAQLGALIREQTCLEAKATILKYDGRPFSAFEIAESVKIQLTKTG